MRSSIHAVYDDFLLSLDKLHRLYPNYYTSELLLLADDVMRWFNGELRRDSSALSYLNKFYHSPREAMIDLLDEIHVEINKQITSEGNGRTLSGLDN